MTLVWTFENASSERGFAGSRKAWHTGLAVFADELPQHMTLRRMQARAALRFRNKTLLLI
jgi:hypothetical protein